MLRSFALVLLFVFAACGGSGGDGDGAAYQAAGPHPVGHAAFTITDVARVRTLDALVWYPAAEGARAAADVGVPVEELVPAAQRATFAGLLSTAPDPGTRRRTRSARDAEPVAAPARLPLVVFSHCFECVAFSSFTIAERLASHGIVVLAPFHAQNTVFEQLTGTGAELEDAFLAVRAGDVSATLDAALADALPPALRGRLDPARVGVFGHSFGGATTGRVLQDDARFIAGATMGAPMRSPFFPSVTLAAIGEPMLFLLLAEDNSIGRIGNSFILENFDEAPQPVWLVQLADAGHWSVSDVCGLNGHFLAGCTTPASRQSDGAPFSYLDITLSRELAASYLTAFFALQLQAADDGASLLRRALGPPGTVTPEARNQ